MLCISKRAEREKRAVDKAQDKKKRIETTKTKKIFTLHPINFISSVFYPPPQIFPQKIFIAHMFREDGIKIENENT
jgi:hypothetical protein